MQATPKVYGITDSVSSNGLSLIVESTFVAQQIHVQRQKPGLSQTLLDASVRVRLYRHERVLTYIENE